MLINCLCILILVSSIRNVSVSNKVDESVDEVCNDFLLYELVYLVIRDCWMKEIPQWMMWRVGVR